MRSSVRALSRSRRSALGLAWVAAAAAPALAQDAENLAKQLSNPVANLISVPLQLNYDRGFGASRDGSKTYLNIQPVIPITLNAEWNLISRTILPVVSQHDVVPGTSQFGLGDTTQSFFFSPKEPTAGGLIWGVGPVLLIPTGTESGLSARKWGFGPTAVVLKQEGPWTFGALANHIWGSAGSDSRPNVNNTFLQPFMAYTTPDAWTFTLNSESSYDWESEQWSVPINMVVSKLLKFDDQLVSIAVGARYWADTPESGPHGWGARFVVTFLFPK